MTRSERTNTQQVEETCGLDRAPPAAFRGVPNPWWRARRFTPLQGLPAAGR
jgi:hypothetical protein